MTSGAKGLLVQINEPRQRQTVSLPRFARDVCYWQILLNNSSIGRRLSLQSRDGRGCGSNSLAAAVALGSVLRAS
jgi:hypothetical protein